MVGHRHHRMNGGVSTTTTPDGGRRRRGRWAIGPRHEGAVEGEAGRLTSSRHPLLLLVLPLRAGQAPAAPQRLVEANMGEETVASDLREGVLGGVELLLGLEYLEV